MPQANGCQKNLHEKNSAHSLVRRRPAARASIWEGRSCGNPALRVGVWLAFAIGQSAPALAHDIWLTQSASPTSTFGGVRVELMIGEAGKPEAMQFNPARVERLWLTSISGVSDLAPSGAQAGLEIAGYASGARALAYISAPSASVLPAAEFDAYLREEHLSAVIALRQSMSAEAAQVPASERYSRSLKLLLDDPTQVLTDCPVGLPLELSVVAADSTQITVRATFRGQPLAGVWVDRAAPSGVVLAEGVTDAAGQWVLPRTDGDWILRATHMLASEDAGVQWRSWWATTAFRLNPNGVSNCAVIAGQ